MKRSILIYLWVAVFCVAGALAASPKVEALMLRGQFPVHNGMYWNFEDNATREKTSWVVMGKFNRSGIGSVIILSIEDLGFVALREEWDGLYLSGEYRMDGYTIPEKPIMFMPFDIDFDQPIKNTTRMRVYSAGEEVSQTGEYDQTVTITLKETVDITFDKREIRNCAVLTKKTEANGKQTIETFWLVPGIGPVKKSIESGGSNRTHVLQTYRTDRGKPPQKFAMEKYFPLNPGTVFEYLDQTGERMSVNIGSKEEKLGWQTIPYNEPFGDIYYLGRDERGVVFPMKFVNTMGFAFISVPPDKPPVLVHNTAVTGQLNRSLTYLYPAGLPSFELMLDFYPEIEIESIILGVEDVTVPAGIYRDCIKLCLVSVMRSFNLKREKVRTGFIWLAPGVGEVKRKVLSFSHAYINPDTDHVFQIQNWELAAVGQSDIPEKPADPGSESVSETQKLSPEPVSPDKLVWQDNSQAMFESVVSAAPFFVRGMVRRTLMDAVCARADSDGLVSEESVIAAAEVSAPAMMRRKIIADLEEMKTR